MVCARIALLFGLVAPALALPIGLAPQVSRAADGNVVVVGGYNLFPREIAVRTGEPVTFQVQEKEEAMVPHTIVGEGGAFRSPPLEPGETWSVRFDEPGVVRYGLEERPSVEGVIVVE